SGAALEQKTSRRCKGSARAVSPGDASTQTVVDSPGGGLSRVWQEASARVSVLSLLHRAVDGGCDCSCGRGAEGLVSERRLSVGLVLEPTGMDNPYCRGAYAGVERAVRELGIRGRVLTPAPREGYVPSLSLLARQKYDLVMGTGIWTASAVDSVATGFPET